MSYSGQTYKIPCDRIGFNANSNIDLIPPESMVHPSRNVNLHEGGIGKRGGTEHLNTTPMTDTPRVMGVYDFTLKSGTQFIIRATSDGKIWKDNTTTIKTGLTSNKVVTFTTFNNKLYIFNGANIPQVWDGSAGTTSNLTNVPTDWTGSNYPTHAVVHGFGNSERMWAFGCPSNPNMVYASKNNDGVAEANFSDAEVVTIYIETGDGVGIIRGLEYQDRLYCIGKSKAYIIDDTDANTANWGYYSSPWEGGVATVRLAATTPNDIVAMAEDGEIYSVTTAQASGDYKAASLSRPAFLHNWIKEHVNMSSIANFHMVYDKELRAIKIFVVRNGQTEVDTAMVYFIDKTPLSGWAIHDNQTNDSGYNASCSALVRVSAGSYKVYTGDYAGYIWKLETTNRADNTVGYNASFKTAILTFDSAESGLIRATKRYDYLRIVTSPKGNYSLGVTVSVDGAQELSDSISLAGTGGVLDSFILGTSQLGGQALIEATVKLGVAGKRIQAELYNSGAYQDFFISQVLFDFKVVGVRP